MKYDEAQRHLQDAQTALGAIQEEAEDKILYNRVEEARCALDEIYNRLNAIMTRNTTDFRKDNPEV